MVVGLKFPCDNSSPPPNGAFAKLWSKIKSRVFPQLESRENEQPRQSRRIEKNIYDSDK